MGELVVRRRDGSEHTILFDEADRETIEAHTWCIAKRKYTSYAATNVPRADGGYRTLFMHTLLMGAVDVDHANGDGLDNRRENLRPATRGQQLANRRGWGRSQFKGVHRRGRRWGAAIIVDGVRTSLGSFDTEEEAATAYQEAARHAWDVYAKPNI